MKNNDLSLTEVSAAIRNKIQTAVIILEFLKEGKQVSKEYINKALDDLKLVERIVS